MAREDIHRGGPGSTCCGAGWICTILVHRGSTNAVIVSVMVAEKDKQAAGEKQSRKPGTLRGEVGGMTTSGLGRYRGRPAGPGGPRVPRGGAARARQPGIRFRAAGWCGMTEGAEPWKPSGRAFVPVERRPFRYGGGRRDARKASAHAACGERRANSHPPSPDPFHRRNYATPMSVQHPGGQYPHSWRSWGGFRGKTVAGDLTGT
jgi:hypothetical protein